MSYCPRCRNTRRVDGLDVERRDFKTGKVVRYPTLTPCSDCRLTVRDGAIVRANEPRKPDHAERAAVERGEV